MKFKITQEKFEKIVLGLLATTLYLTFQYFAIKLFLIEAPLSFGTIIFTLFLSILFIGFFIGALQEIGVIEFKEEE